MTWPQLYAQRLGCTAEGLGPSTWPEVWQGTPIDRCETVAAAAELRGVAASTPQEVSLALTVVWVFAMALVLAIALLFFSGPKGLE